MLLKHSSFYLLSIGVPGVVNLLAITVFTRLLSPEAYGQYALVVAGTGLLNAVLFRWIHLGLLRFYASNQGHTDVFLSTVFAAYLLIVCLSGLLGFAGLSIIDDAGYKILMLLGLWILWLQAFFELNKELARSQFLHKRYGFFTLSKALISLSSGTLLVLLGLGAKGLLCGSLLGMLVPVIWVFRKEWKRVRIRHVDRDLFAQFLSYGLPLTAAYALGFVVTSSDRFLLGWLLHSEATGLYSVGYDLAKQALSMGLMVVNLAAYPLAVNALEKHGVEQANVQLSNNIILLLAVALPSTTGLMLLAPNIAQVFLGEMFRDTATILMPWIAVGTFLAGVKAYYCDLSFQLSRHTKGQVWVVLVAAVVNVILNFWWIPEFGLLGAAYSTVAAYACGITLSLYWGRSLFVLPWPFRDIIKLVAATFGMVLALIPIMDFRGGGYLLLQVFIGALVFFLSAWCLDIGGLRRQLAKSIGT